jgi:peptidoglycan hydrolase CwlO-like protein
MKDTVHIHKDYNTSFCGQDAAHIPMTYIAAEATCKECTEALEAEHKRLAEESEAHDAKAKEFIEPFNEADNKLQKLNGEIAILEREHAETLAAKIAARDEVYKERTELLGKGTDALNDKRAADEAIAALPTL